LKAHGGEKAGDIRVVAAAVVDYQNTRRPLA
jgi:hypothetical protein